MDILRSSRRAAREASGRRAGGRGGLACAGNADGSHALPLRGVHAVARAPVAAARGARGAAHPALPRPADPARRAARGGPATAARSWTASGPTWSSRTARCRRRCARCGGRWATSERHHPHGLAARLPVRLPRARGAGRRRPTRRCRSAARAGRARRTRAIASPTHWRASSTRAASDEVRRDAAEELHALGTARGAAPPRGGRAGAGRERARAWAHLRDSRWDVAGAGAVPLLEPPAGPAAWAALVSLRLRRALRLAGARWAQASAGGAIAGALAGLLGGLVMAALGGSGAPSLLVALALVGAVVAGRGRGRRRLRPRRGRGDRSARGGSPRSPCSARSAGRSSPSSRATSRWVSLDGLFGLGAPGDRRRPRGPGARCRGGARLRPRHAAHEGRRRRTARPGAPSRRRGDRARLRAGGPPWYRRPAAASAR